MMNYALQNEMRSCINDMRQTAKYLDEAADKLEASLQGLGKMNICKRMRSDANEYRKAANEMGKALY
mgnify:CR=1 FL=1